MVLAQFSSGSFEKIAKIATENRQNRQMTEFGQTYTMVPSALPHYQKHVLYSLTDNVASCRPKVSTLRHPNSNIRLYGYAIHFGLYRQ